MKTTAKASRGLPQQLENVDSSLLLDAADFTGETAWLCQELLVGIGFADEANSNDDTVSCSRDGHAVGRFTRPSTAL